MNGRPLFSIHPSSFILHRSPVPAEIILVFAVFFLQGAWPVPEVNEPYYLGKAIHYWNPGWVEDDFFLESKDTHTVFYFTFGWLALWLRPTALAWIGRVLTWGLLAWAWRRLSFAVVPRRWACVLTAALWVCLLERCHMAGEWVIGGVEAKGFAYVLVLLGLEALVGNRWNRAWLLLGAASAFHVLVGGWAVVAAMMAWLMLGRQRPALRPMWPALFGGFLLSLPGLIPSLILNWGTDGQTIREANQIYVYARLYHHLNPAQLPPAFIRRFLLLSALWLALCWVTPAVACPSRARGATTRRLRAFVIGAVAIALLGAAIGLLGSCQRALAAGLLRFYWFRLADVAVPLGVALEGTWFALRTVQSRPAVGRCSLAIAILIAGIHVGGHALQRPFPTLPRAYRTPVDRSPVEQLRLYSNWRHVCAWISRPGNVPPHARFLTPMMSQTFKWYAGRSEVANWKEVPQDAKAIVEWWRRLNDLYGTGSHPPDPPWHASLAELGAERLKQLAAEYDADYVITPARPPLPLEIVYPKNEKHLQNESTLYVIYRFSP